MKHLHMKIAIGTLLLGMLTLGTGAALVQDEGDDGKTPPKYVGLSSCKKCHQKGSIGKQYKVWKKSKHAGAYEMLKSERSAEVAKKAGVTKPAHEAPECLKCHTTAYGLDKKKNYGPKFKLEDGVSCEACHGAGEFFDKPKDKKKHEEAVGKGYVTPTEELCRKCHNEESPTWNPEADTTEAGEKVGFDFKARLKVIAHPIPKEEDK